MVEHVLDANVFIHGNQYDLAVLEHPLTVPAVTAELRSTEAQIRFDIDDVTVVEPDGDTVEAVALAAREKGEPLSDTDIALIALARDRDAVLVTDDYGMQNVATAIDVDFMGFLQDEITEEIDWTYVCVECGKELSMDVDRCPVCGGDVDRRST